MATRQLLAELAAVYRQHSGIALRVESVGGVDAARRVQAGERFDLVVLARDAMDKLAAGGFVDGDSLCPLVDSAVAVAVRAGAPLADISSEAALRDTLLQAASIGYSSGPSGNALLKLIAGWGLDDSLKSRLVQAPPGTPVGQLVASGQVQIGFQQLSELLGVEGITLLGGMPAGLEIVTTFVGAMGAGCPQPDAVRALLCYFSASHTTALKQRLGMDAPAGAAH
jgi:molybdate transport system substrate-binding protein